MERGYVKLWRKTLDSGLLGHPNAWALFTWMLLKAAWKPAKYATRWGVIDMRPGQVIVSRRKLAAELQLGEQRIRTAMDLLQKLEIITHETTQGLTRITIVKWEEYQAKDGELTHSLTHAQPTPNPHLTQEEEGKKERKKEHPPKAAAGAAGFDAFWMAYPKKVGKGAALKAWQKAKPPLQACLDGLAWQKRLPQWDKDGGQFVPNPATWLNQSRWLDEQESGRGRGGGSTQALGAIKMLPDGTPDF